LSWSATPGDTILDPCCGCGPIFPAATQFQCTAIGWELNPAHFATAMLRTTSSEVL
jgi:tRNA G10  N-methylase Trm11